MKSLLFIIFMIFSSGVFSATTRELQGDTIISADKTKTFTLPASTGTLIVSGAVPIATQFITQSFTANSSTTAFTLTYAPPNTAEVKVFLNGILQTITTDYTISSTTLTFVTAPVTGQDIKVTYSRY